jgi:glycogen operon protein
VARLVALRREYPVLRHQTFLHGMAHPAPGIADIAWFDRTGKIIPAEAWNDAEQRTLILRRSMRVPEGKVTVLTLLLNPEDKPSDFQLPEPQLPGRVLVDSCEPQASERWIEERRVRVASHSAILVHSELAG